MDYFLFLERCSIYVDVSSPTTNEHKKQTILICLGFKTDIRKETVSGGDIKKVKSKIKFVTGIIHLVRAKFFFSEKITFLTTWYVSIRKCAYQEVRNASFSETLVYVLKG